VEPLLALERIAYLLELRGDPRYKVEAFRKAADVVATTDADDLAARARTGRLKDLAGIGDTTARVIEEAYTGRVPSYLERLEIDTSTDELGAGDEVRGWLRGDLHLHTKWSDGGAEIMAMAETAQEIGHEYLAITDHSPQLTVARGLEPERLREQLDTIDELNAQLAPFRLLTGIEVDILDDGSLDQEEELLARLDVVVASVHSKLRMEREPMTQRMVVAAANPHVDVLGHCTGRLVTGNRGTRAQSEFEAAKVFAACAENGVAVEINARPERRDPPTTLLKLAIETGCLFSIDSDAHAPGQLDFQVYGCARAEELGLDPDRIVNTWPKDRLVSWAQSRV
jgi:putative hydrolase